MMDLPADTPLLWVGLTLACAGFVAVAGSLPVRPLPDATAAAQTVDTVAAGDAPASATRPLTAERVRLRPHGIALTNDAGTSRATFAFGPVTPVTPDSPLWAVLRGDAPETAFEDHQAFRQAVIEARSADPRWRPATTLHVREVSWDGYRVTLVGA